MCDMRCVRVAQCVIRVDPEAREPRGSIGSGNRIDSCLIRETATESVICENRKPMGSLPHIRQLKRVIAADRVGRFIVGVVAEFRKRDVVVNVSSWRKYL